MWYSLEKMNDLFIYEKKGMYGVFSIECLNENEKVERYEYSYHNIEWMSGKFQWKYSLVYNKTIKFSWGCYSNIPFNFIYQKPQHNIRALC